MNKRVMGGPLAWFGAGWGTSKTVKFPLALKKLHVAAEEPAASSLRRHVGSQMALGTARCATSGPTNALRWSCEVFPRSLASVSENPGAVGDTVLH